MSLLSYLGFYVTFNTVQVISRWIVGRAKETSTYSWSRSCTVNWRPTASNYQLSHLRSGREPNPDLRGGWQACYHSATMAPRMTLIHADKACTKIQPMKIWLDWLVTDVMCKCLIYWQRATEWEHWCFMINIQDCYFLLSGDAVSEANVLVMQIQLCLWWL